LFRIGYKSSLQRFFIGATGQKNQEKKQDEESKKYHRVSQNLSIFKSIVGEQRGNREPGTMHRIKGWRKGGKLKRNGASGQFHQERGE